MTDVCEPLWCPFIGCASCEYQGGERASAGKVFDMECETMGVRKTAPDQCANTAEGLTTNDAVGVEMAAPNLTPLTGSAAANLDGCPSCVDNAELPYAGFTASTGGLVCMYVCTDCGHRWHTSWAA